MFGLSNQHIKQVGAASPGFVPSSTNYSFIDDLFFSQ
jgi:hypothetical protein